MSYPLRNKLFPSLQNFDWGTINLNECAKIISKIAPSDEPFLDPKKQIALIELIHSIKEVDCTHGGYLEDRSDLWKGHYHEPGATWHLGIDYNVPENTSVYLPVKATLIHSVIDKDQYGGWGGKMIFQAENGIYFILGHLKNMMERKVYNPGIYVGEIAGPECNGNWYPHLHVQCMRKLDLDVDGYSKMYDEIKEDFPNPELVFS
jgi:hypothetical protein